MNANDRIKHPAFESELEYEGFHKRLESLMEGFKSPRAFALACGISQSGLSRISDGGYPTLPILANIAKANNVSLDWLTFGIGSMAMEQAARIEQVQDVNGHLINVNEFYFIPKYCEVAEQSAQDFLAFRKNWIDTVVKAEPTKLFTINVSGDSMSGEIEDGDTLLVNQEEVALSDGIYLLRIDGDLLVKRVQKMPNQIIRVSSANKVYEPFQIDMNDLPKDFEVMGKVVWIGRYLP